MLIDTVRLITGPLLCSVVGYATNYIAVKMLFRPLKPVKIGKYTVPFTPGIIPKRKDRLAKTIGNAVGKNLLTKEDLRMAITDDKVKQGIIDNICERIFDDDPISLKNIVRNYTSEEEYFGILIRTSDIICDRIIEGTKKIGIASIITDKASKLVMEKVNGTFLAMMLNEELIASLTSTMGDEIEKYIDENGKSIIESTVNEEIKSLMQKDIAEIINNQGYDREFIKSIIDKVYDSIIYSQADKIFDTLDIQELVSDKVNDMDVIEIEDLVLSVMKNELNAIVNLGALIGLIIGMIQLLF